MQNIRLYLAYFIFSAVLSGLVLLRYGAALWPVAAWFAAGLLLGAVVLWFDENIAYPKYRALDGETVHLVSRSTLFIVAYVPLTLFLLTSSGSLFAMGLILGIGIQLALEMMLLRNRLEEFTQRFLQLRRSLTLTELQGITYGFSFFVTVAAVLAVL